MNRKVKKVIMLIGLSVISLIILAIFVVVFEQLGFIQFSVGPRLVGLSPLDTWLIVILLIFGPAMFGAYYLLYKLKVVKI